MTIYVPTITYQYSNEGHLDNGAPTPFVFTPDVRERFQIWFSRQYPEYPGAYERLQTLLREQLDELPDNPIVQSEAWVAGVTDEQNSHVRGWYEAYESEQDYRREQAAAELARAERRRDFESRFEVRVVRQIREQGSEGLGSETFGEVLEVRERSTGQTLRIAVRNVFDFGRVINLEPRRGGVHRNEGLVANFDSATQRLCWMRFTSGHGWERIRDVEPFEAATVQYLEEFSPVSGRVRLDPAD